jgi:hypothetical protein
MKFYEKLHTAVAEGCIAFAKAKTHNFPNFHYQKTIDPDCRISRKPGNIGDLITHCRCCKKLMQDYRRPISTSITLMSYVPVWVVFYNPYRDATAAETVAFSQVKHRFIRSDLANQ